MNGETFLPYTIAAIAIGWAVWLQIKEHRRLKREADEKYHDDLLGLKASLDHLAGILDLNKDISRGMADGLNTLPALLTGITDLIKEETVKVDTLNRAVELLSSCMTPAADSDKYEAYAQEHSPSAKREIDDLIRRGLDPEVAEARVREKNIYEELSRSRR